jgi:hypothetical protein
LLIVKAFELLLVAQLYRKPPNGLLVYPEARWATKVYEGDGRLSERKCFSGYREAEIHSVILFLGSNLRSSVKPQRVDETSSLSFIW